MNTALAKAIASAYDAMPHDPGNSQVAESYRAFIHETLQQFCDITDKLIVLGVTKNPYASSQEMFSDVESGELAVYVGGDLPYDHPLSAPTLFGVGCNLPNINCVFRAVHDILGHYATRSGFGPKGEETAWRAHSLMYSPLAKLAMTTETLGQNCWVNYGPYGTFNRAYPSKTIYAPQKAGLLPEFCLAID